MPESKSLLSADQVRALAALIDARSLPEAAERAGVTTEQLGAWINHDEAFQDHLECDAEDAFQLAGHQLLYMTTLATRALTEVLEDPSGGDGSLARVQAAHMVLHQARIYRATDGLEGRLTDLERSRDAVLKAQAQCVCGAAHRA